jgi:uncharacterized protein involved in copper resistance
MTKRMRAAPLGSAIPAFAKPNPKVEMADYEGTPSAPMGATEQLRPANDPQYRKTVPGKKATAGPE